MSADQDAADGTRDAALSRESLADQLRQLEAFVATAESQGDALPPEAVEMVVRLKEIMEALDGLATSFEVASHDASAKGSTPPEA
jgi:hypothetical protein